MSENEAKKKPCSCPKCAALCSGKPGWFAPGEATKAASELGMTLVEFFTKLLTRDFYVLDYEKDNDDDRSSRLYLLSPAWVGNNGKTAAYEDSHRRGPCALLGPSGCRLSFETRPRECRVSYGCAPMSRPEAYAIQDEIVAAWKAQPEEIRALIAAGAVNSVDDGGKAMPVSAFASLLGRYF